MNQHEVARGDRDISNKPNKTSTSYSVAAWWPNDGYGGFKPAESFSDAVCQVENLIQRGFGKQGRSEVRIVKTVKSHWSFVASRYFWCQTHGRVAINEPNCGRGDDCMCVGPYSTQEEAKDFSRSDNE